MAQARVKLVCKTCGKTFERRRTRNTRRAADNYAAWAADNITTCSACRRKMRRAKIEATLKIYGAKLPKVTGVSAKQIAFALDVREKYLASNIAKLDDYLDYIACVAENREDMQKDCADAGTTLEDVVARTLGERGLTAMAIMVTSTDAQQLLDARP